MILKPKSTNTSKKMISFKHRILAFSMMTIIPLIIFFIFGNIYYIRDLNLRASELSKNALYTNVSDLELKLSNIENYMADIIANNYEFGKLEYITTSLEAHLSSYNILDMNKSALQSNPIVSCFFVFSFPNDLYRVQYAKTYSLETKTKILEYLKDEIQTDKNCIKRGWFSKTIDQKSFLFRIMGIKGAYNICMIDFDSLLKPQNVDEGIDTNLYLYATQDGTPLLYKDFIYQNSIDLSQISDSYYVAGDKVKYLVMKQKIAKTDTNMILILPKLSLFVNLNDIQIIILLISLCSVLLIPSAYYLLKSHFFGPLEKLVATMNTIKDGDIDAQINNDSEILEYKQVNETFNEMMTRINQLKIETYEKKLEVQKAQFQYLQIQIRPHFFLNCLKNLYAMAAKQEYKEIEDMILVLSDYIRYYFKDNLVLVSFADELSSIKNYINLQRMSASYPPVCELDIDENLLDINIPPLSILTFVENCIKHAAIPKKMLKINIRACLLNCDDKNYVNITISDNGKGFDEDQLHSLNFEQGNLYEDKHIGICNVCHRLKILYGEDAGIAFSNGEEGSVVDIFIPSSN